MFLDKRSTHFIFATHVLMKNQINTARQRNKKQKPFTQKNSNNKDPTSLNLPHHHQIQYITSLKD